MRQNEYLWSKGLKIQGNMISEHAVINPDSDIEIYVCQRNFFSGFSPKILFHFVFPGVVKGFNSTKC